MSAFEDYLHISSFLNNYLCKEMLLAVQYPAHSQTEIGPHGEEISKYSLIKDLLYECSTGEATEKLNRSLNTRELAFVSERIEGFLIENSDGTLGR